MTYPLLDRTKDDIRLVSFTVPDDPGMSIRCTTSTTSLSTAIKSKFKALSHIAENHGGGRRTLILNGERTWVATDLDTALRMLHNHEQNLVWVDALCTNQNDEVEKVQQANLMPRIFAQADVVFAYVGDSSRWTNSAFLFMQTWAKLDCDFEDVEQIQNLAKKPELWKRQTWQQVDDLFYLPFWTQRWALQELVLARSAFFLCGKKKIAFGDIERAIEIWELLKETGRASLMQKYAFAITPAKAASKTLHLHLNLRSRRGKTRDGLQKLNLAELCRNIDISEYTQDELYALSRVGENCSGGIEDEKSVRQMLIDFAAKVINDSDDLSILEVAGIADKNPTERFDLPSWAPTWKRGRCLPLPKLYNASGHSKATCYFGEDESLGQQNRSRFFATGVKCGTVLEVDSAENMVKCPAQILGGEFAQYRVHEKHPTGIPVIQAIFRTMLLDQNPGFGRRLNHCDNHFFDLAAGFLFMLQLVDQAKSEDLMEMVKNYNLTVDSEGVLPDFAESFSRYRHRKKDNQHMRELWQMRDILRPFLGPTFIPLTEISTTIVWPNEHNRQRGGANLRPFLVEASKCLKGRCMFSLNQGYFGVGPMGMQSKDIVSVIWGCDTPVVLRKVEDYYVLVGPCFVLGLMDGEANKMVQEGTKRKRVFSLR
ncbi:heterokaryon incompatibility protein-domain-containing protein [Amylocarpus encephaloides]|uniref:Heterokaryon incompatibility protein-domain-containing protein n=1 Tax=Amylocarpus encephaloides TaxID=45428 RepID=A0A9P7Y7R6_9HELO|nr:heterokaryon incompatibility protein-domain-containing protein [Amylocarpus encephaloides]